jgi:gamma-glutamyltranspeptidase/glutathione hydrolase
VATAPAHPRATDPGSSPPPLAGGGPRAVESRSGVVVTSEANATRAGVAALEHGGTAADAVVAAAYALAVTHPSAGNLGGGGFVLYRPKGGPTVVVEFRERAPAAVTQARFDKMIADKALGPAAAGVPGSVAGLELVRERFGRLSRKDDLAAAVALARKGFTLGAYQAATIAWAWPALSLDPNARKVFGAGGHPLKGGAHLVQPELAATLDRIAERGVAGFYEGDTAAKIVALADRGGMISPSDLEGYRAVVREPIRIRYRGFSVETAPPPSAGGVTALVMLGMLEKLDAKRFAPLSADGVHLFAEVARRAHTVRRFEVVDPDSVPGYDLGAKVAAWLDADRELARFPAIDMAHATPSRAVHPLYDAAVKELEHTTHLAAVDAEGNVAACTTTLSASFGSKVMAAGVMLNDSLAAFGTAGESVPAPGRRMPTSMSPTLVLAGDEPVLVLGTPGGDTIPNTVVRVLTNLVDHGMTLDAAVDAPRVHQGFVPDEIRYEGGRPLPRAVLAELVGRGHRLDAKTRAIGDANSVLVAKGAAFAYADPRGGGLAAAARAPTR